MSIYFQDDDVQTTNRKFEILPTWPGKSSLRKYNSRKEDIVFANFLPRHSK